MTDEMSESLSPREDVTALKNTIAALRGELKDLKAKYQGIDDPSVALNAITELAALKPQYQELQQRQTELLEQVNTAKIDTAIASILAGVDPSYSDLLGSHIRPLLQVSDDGMVTSAQGRSLDDLRRDYQTRYPQMFLATSQPIPSGSGNAPSQGQPTPPTVVQRQNGIISGVNPADVLSGTIKIT